MLYKSSFETAAQSEMVGALFELYLALMRDVKKGIFYSVGVNFFSEFLTNEKAAHHFSSLLIGRVF